MHQLPVFDRAGDILTVIDIDIDASKYRHADGLPGAWREPLREAPGDVNRAADGVNRAADSDGHEPGTGGDSDRGRTHDARADSLG
jgi:hypothetical protein